MGGLYLSPLYTPVPEPDGYQFRRDDHRTVFLRGETALRVLPRLLPLLDGTRERISIDGIPQEEVEAVLAGLTREGLLIDPIDEADPWKRDAIAAAGRARAGVRLSLPDGCAADFESALGRVGIGSENPSLTISTRPVAGPWLRVAWSAGVAEVGPLFVPKETPCPECFSARLMSNRRFPESFRRFEEQGGGPVVRFAPAVLWCASQASLEALRFAAGGPMLCGRLFWFDMERLESGLETVLRVPRCRGCR
jgi:hypothetical protein